MLESLEESPRSNTPIQIIVIGNGVLECTADAGAENEVTALLAFVGNLTSHSALISYIDLEGDAQIMEQTELKMDENEDELGYQTLLIRKARELIGARNFRLELSSAEPAPTS